MVKSYKQLTGRYLKANKKRSTLTIIGIILSVALISTIGLFFKGMQDSQIEYNKKTSGSYHLMFTKTNEKLISNIVNNPKVSRSGLYIEGEEFKISDNLVGSEITATDDALELFPNGMEKGRLPKNKNEVAMESWVLSRIDKTAKVGAEIKINNRSYILVGVLKDSLKSQYTDKARIYTKDNSINKGNASLLVEVSSKTNLTKAVNQLKKLGDKDNIQENTDLLSVEGYNDGSSTAKGIILTLAIIIGIVVISTIAVIYNSFQISVVERIKQFGLLRAVGGTPKQIRRLVLREATVLAVIAVPIGLICGILASYAIGLVFKLVGGNELSYITLTISPKILLASAAVGLITIYLSAILPAHFAGKTSPLNAISGRTAITKEKIKKRKNPIVKKIFGFEGLMAYKNIKRNRKRYRITVFSIVISVMLFITFKSFMDMSLNIYKTSNESSKTDFTISTYHGGDISSDKENIDNNILNKIKVLPTVEKIYSEYKTYDFDMAIDNSSRIKKVNKMGSIYKNISYKSKDMTLIESSINIYDDASILASKSYLESGSIDLENLKKENGVILIKKDSIFNNKTGKTFIGPVADVKVGDEIQVQYNGNEENENKTKIEFGKGNAQKVKVVAILNDNPFNYNGASDGLKIITSEELGKKLIGSNNLVRHSLNVRLKDVKDETLAKNQIDEALKTDSNVKVVNNIDSNRTENSSILMMQLLMYGFVLVVSLIGSVNIINTLTTNIIVRKREFATLKSIGLTQKGLKKMIVLEGLLYGIVGTIYGSILGCGFSYLLYMSLGSIREFLWSVPWNAIAIAGVCALVLGYLSVLSPLARIKKENIIQSVREDF